VHRWIWDRWMHSLPVNAIDARTDVGCAVCPLAQRCRAAVDRRVLMAASRPSQNRACPQHCLTLTWGAAQVGGPVDAAGGARNYTGARRIVLRHYSRAVSTIGNTVHPTPDRRFCASSRGLRPWPPGRRPAFATARDPLISWGVAPIVPHHGGLPARSRRADVHEGSCPSSTASLESRRPRRRQAAASLSNVRAVRGRKVMTGPTHRDARGRA